MNEIPVNFQFLNEYTSKTSPSTVHSRNTNLTRYFERYLLQRVMSVFKFDGIPEEWDKDYFMYTLFINGYVCILETDKYGVIPQHCSLGGRNVFYAPSYCVVSNPLLRGIKMPRIGSECALIKMQPDYCGVWDIVSFYADMLALTSEAAGVNLVNSKLAFVFGCGSKTIAESFKKMYDQLTAGNPAVFVDNKLFKDDGSENWHVFNQNLDQNYIGDKLMADYHRWMNLFNTEIGIPNANYEKSERLITDEVNANNTETESKASLWLETMQKGIDMANDMFGLEISVKLRYNYDVNRSDQDDFTEEDEEE